MIGRRVAAVGDNCVDVYVNRGVSAIGGNALNVAVRLARHDHAVEYLGVVGQDAAGQRVLAALADAGVGTAAVRAEEGDTARTLLALSESGEREILEETYELPNAYMPGDSDLDRLRDADHVHAAGAPRVQPLLEDLRAQGMRVSYDFTTQRGELPVNGLEVAFVSGHDLSTAEARELASDLVRRGARAAVVTMGEAGSAGSDASESVVIPAEPASVIDTCGAGDAYIAAFLDGRLRGLGLEASMRAGAREAAEACEVLGAWPQELPATEGAAR